MANRNSGKWRALCPPFAFLAMALSGWAQEIRVYTEMQRPDPFGKIVEADRAPHGRSREVLSPALPRNAFSTFHIAVEAPQGVPYWLYIGMNPEELIQATLYKEIFELRDGKWVADKLVKVELPYNGLVPEKHIPGQTVEVFLLDLYVPRNVEVRRMKVEPQMWIPDRWITYPMEARLVSRQLLTQPLKGGRIAPVEAPADTTYRYVFTDVFCGSTENNAPVEALTIRSLLQRNAHQDVALAKPFGKIFAGPFLGYGEAPDFCKLPALGTPKDGGPEQVLRLRDRLLRERP